VLGGFVVGVAEKGSERGGELVSVGERWRREDNAAAGFEVESNPVKFYALPGYLFMGNIRLRA